MPRPVDFSGPVFDQPAGALADQLVRAYLQAVFELAGPVAATQINAASPRQTGKLARSFFVRWNGEIPSVDYGYTPPGIHYWHLPRGGQWPAQWERIIIDSIRAASPVALNRATAKVFP